MNTFKPRALHYMGSNMQSIGITIESQDFNDWCKKHEVTEMQIDFVKQGYRGEPFVTAPDPKSGEMSMPFGKYKDYLIKNVPEYYLQWLIGQDIEEKYPDLHTEIKKTLSGGLTSDDIADILTIDI